MLAVTGDGAPFGFVQFEHAGRVGPDPGRYVVRRYAGDDPQHVLVIGAAGAPRHGFLASRRRRRPRAVDPGPSDEPLEVTRLTVIGAEPLADPEAWLGRAAADARTVEDAARLVNRALAAYRLGAADPYVADVSPARALAVRVGYGTGAAVADGRWTAARELPRGGRRPGALLQPQERLAALLGGRDVALACEELALRARLDFDQGREREAVIGAEAAVRTALAELSGWRGVAGMPARLAELADEHAILVTLAAAAVQGGLEGGQRERAAQALGRLEAALRARLVDARR